MRRARWLAAAAISLCILPTFFGPAAVRPEAAYSHARLSFLEGYLEAAQREAESGYARFLYSAPLWARKFQLLEAKALVSRELNEKALVVLSDANISGADKDATIEQLTLRTTALMRLQNLSEADEAIHQAKLLCAPIPSPSCGGAFNANGLLLLERGLIGPAETEFLSGLKFARSINDRELEATTLLNLGQIATRREHHDEAIEYYRAADRAAMRIGANNYVRRAAFGDIGWEEYSTGNFEKALEAFWESARSAEAVGDTGGEIEWTITSGLAYAETGRLDLAEATDLRAISLARKTAQKQSIINASEDLARIYIRQGKPAEADNYARGALVLAQQTGNRLDLIECSLLQGQAAALRHEWQRSAELLQMVAESSDSPTSRKWQAQHALGRMYESEGDPASARRSYEAALVLIESARADLKQEVSRLTFLENASSIYDDYIHLLVSEGKTQEALEAADWSRARTLQQGLGSIARPGANAYASLRTVTAEVAGAPKLKAVDIARRTNSTLLFYWLGEKQSYLWAISPEETCLFTLPPRSAILPLMERYRRAILGLKDPLRDGAGEVAADGASLYQILVAPAAKQLRADRPVVLLVDGEIGQLNFETLLAPSPSPHFWIENATVLLAPSIHMFAETAHDVRRPGKAADTMLLFGDTVPVGTEFRPLPMAAREVETVKGYFAGTANVLQGAKATPTSYLASDLGRFEYIHFVAHGTASRTDPLESAVILSPDGAGEDSYKLYAREIVRHPINARLVTISACNSSGSKSFAGEGLVGLSWAFLRAGAHNAIGSLWEVSDASTPELMNTLYGELQRGQPPASALRSAKLNLIRSGGHFSRPFYWAPFQLYAGR